MAEIPNIEPNSKKYHEEKAALEARKPKPVVKGAVSVKRKTLLDRFKSTFIKEDPKNVRKYIIQEVIIPAIIDNAYDILTSAYDMTFRGETVRRQKKGLINSLGSKINYGSFFSGGEKKEKMPNYQRSDIGHSFDNICFESRGDAELVLDNMTDILSRYEVVRVADFYELAGITGEFTDNDFGWKDLSSAKVSRSRDGYFIDLPRCIPIK